MAAFAAAYFDDQLSVEFIRWSDVSQLGLRLSFEALIAPPPSRPKRLHQRPTGTTWVLPSMLVILSGMASSGSSPSHLQLPRSATTLLQL